MFELIKSDDKNVLANSNFAKNAIFFKDMLSFMEAYDLILQRKENLPNFCYLHNGEICLEGICLFVKMYATEFKFETIKLTLDYLKVLYYTIASYSVDGKTADREIIIAEFDKYREASIDYCKKNKEELDSQEKKYREKESGYFKAQQTSKKLETSSKIMSVLSVIIYIFSLVGGGLPFVFSFCFPSTTNMIVAAVAAFSVFVITATTMKVLSKKFNNKSAEIDYKSQVAKKVNETEYAELVQAQDKFNKIVCEKYEYKMCFAELFSRYGKTLEIDEILERARKYKLLSYNIVYDVNRIFVSQQNEINEINTDVENIIFDENAAGEFAGIYSKILDQDWLYFNAEIRMHFLKKFADFAEKNYCWSLEINGVKTNPFDVKVKDLSREKVAYLFESDKKFISANLNDFMHTNIVKNLEELNFKGNYSIETLKRVKSNFLRSFYNYDCADSENAFYDKKNQKLDIQKFDETEKIPTFINMKLKLIEDSVGLGNSDAKVIKALAQNSFEDEQIPEIEKPVFSEEFVTYPSVLSTDVYEDDENIVYNVNGKKIIGKKIN